MKKNNKGFTLAELLIVVAIIAVLAAIAIPVFSSQLEKAREATDLANIRSAYAEVMTSAVTGDKSSDNVSVTGDTAKTYSATVNLVQKEAGWQQSVTSVGGVSVSDLGVGAGKTVTISITDGSTVPSITVA